jgi:putative flavoprotein involved in K+ transport
MNRTDALIIGAGQAGLAMSRALRIRGIEHVVLERGRIGERWRSERWDSLHLLTTSAYGALPGLEHLDVDPESFMPAAGFANYLDRYAGAFAVPVIRGAEVTAVEASQGGYQVATSTRIWRARSVIIATGACDVPHRPQQAANLPASVTQISPAEYRSPAGLPDGGVLVVGASSSGVQIAEEVHASGRPVTLAVGDHTRMPRRYRGRDIYAWMDMAGILDDPADESGNLEAVRRQPSLQLVGRPDHGNLDLAVLAAQGVRLAGRLASINGSLVSFQSDLARATMKSHIRMSKTLYRIDRFIESHGLSAPRSDSDQPQPFIPCRDATALDLGRENIRTVIWATGYRRSYRWLHVPVLDGNGEIMHRSGVTSAPGLFVLGLNFLRRRRSAFIDGCGLDAAEIADLVKSHLDRAVGQAA